MKKPELLMPAGSLDVLRTAVNFGADAVYIGGEAYSLRSKARNFTEEDMEEAVSYAHSRGVKVYVAANIIARNRDLSGMRAYFEDLSRISPDALIIADPGVFVTAGEVCPDIPVHVSTQANCTNYEDFLFWHRLGATRVVCARELSLDEIKEIRGKVPDELEIEAFVHGAMCISYSGRCLLSNYFTGRGANRGECTHPCRWTYSVVEESRPGEYMPVYEDECGTYIFNSKDLCMLGHIPELIDAGIDSFKVEGRMKTALYAASVARTYRKAIDDYLDGEDVYRQNLGWYIDQIKACTYREFTTGFYFSQPDYTSQIYDSNTYRRGSTYLGTVRGITDGLILTEQKNKFSVGEEIEIMKPDGRDIAATVTGIWDMGGEAQESAPHPGQKIKVMTDPEAACVGDILRRPER